MPSNHVLDPSRVSAPFHTLGLPVTRTTSGLRVVSGSGSITPTSVDGHGDANLNAQGSKNVKRSESNADMACVENYHADIAYILYRERAFVPMCTDGETSVRFDNVPLSTMHL